MDLSLLTQYLHPYWEGDKIFRESVLFARSQSGSPLPASLLYPATQIYSVESADLTIQYTEGLDYQFSQGKLLWQEGSSHSLPDL